MDFESLRNYCLEKKGATEDFPFGDDVWVMKVGSKMFALIAPGDTLMITLKCDPSLAEALREKYSSVNPGYYMNKRHWNSVDIDGTVPDGDIERMIDHSYELVFKGLKKAERESIASL
ncbi:MAG: MmcQ/YjbR family DNA-binding protein [Candidatus Electryoneaceae bacterium]|nr:MmcQ/YjbR family DNA-binding protein [Candidatus Electryoneaceae bacterium]